MTAADRGMSHALYPASRIKRPRATQVEMRARLASIVSLVRLIQPCSVRQAFYQAEVKSVVETAEASERTVAASFLRQQRFNGGDGP